MKDTLTTVQAAELLGVSVSRIEQHCRSGRLGKTYGKFGGAWVITRAEIGPVKCEHAECVGDAWLIWMTPEEYDAAKRQT